MLQPSAHVRGRAFPDVSRRTAARSQFTPASGCASSVAADTRPVVAKRKPGAERALNGIDVVRGDLADPDTLAASLGKVGGVDQSRTPATEAPRSQDAFEQAEDEPLAAGVRSRLSVSGGGAQ